MIYVFDVTSPNGEHNYAYAYFLSSAGEINGILASSPMPHDVTTAKTEDDAQRVIAYDGWTGRFPTRIRGWVTSCRLSDATEAQAWLQELADSEDAVPVSLLMKMDDAADDITRVLERYLDVESDVLRDMAKFLKNARSAEQKLSILNDWLDVDPEAIQFVLADLMKLELPGEKTKSANKK